MSNSTARFSRMKTTIFREMIQEVILVNNKDYFDIPGSKLEELYQRNIRFLEIADKHNLYFKRSKCEFNAKEISILGMVIGGGKAKMEEEKINAVKNWKTPTTVKQVESFLGFANFYRRFIKDFSTIAAPLNKLKKEEREWKWGERQQTAFEAIKQAITNQPVLALPKAFGQFRVKEDASNYGTAEALLQLQADKCHPIP